MSSEDASGPAVLAEFSGCVYETPTPDDQERDWRVDSATGNVFPFDLTVSEMKGMRLRDVPIKIEHTLEGFSADDEVGRVTDSVTDPTTGYTAIKFALHDTVAGRTVARLIRGGTLDSLSLGHMYDVASGSVTPSEVSVCFNGARSGSHLYKEMQNYDRLKTEVENKLSQMASIEQQIAPAPDAEQPAPVPATDALATALGGAAAPTPEATAAAPPTEAPKDLADLLETVTSVPGVDQNLATELFRQVADIVSDRKQQAEQQEKQQRVIADLEKQVASISEKNKNDTAKVVACMNALLAEYVGENASISTAVDGDNALREVAMQVPVLASALNAHKSASVKVDSLASLRSGLAAEIKKALSPSPWREEQPVVEQTPTRVLVNASARERAPQQAERPTKHTRFAGLTPGQQAALSGFSSFGDGTAPRLTPDMLPGNFNGMKN